MDPDGNVADVVRILRQLVAEIVPEWERRSRQACEAGNPWRTLFDVAGGAYDEEAFRDALAAVVDDESLHGLPEARQVLTDAPVENPLPTACSVELDDRIQPRRQEIHRADALAAVVEAWTEGGADGATAEAAAEEEEEDVDAEMLLWNEVPVPLSVSDERCGVAERAGPRARRHLSVLFLAWTLTPGRAGAIERAGDACLGPALPLRLEGAAEASRPCLPGALASRLRSTYFGPTDRRYVALAAFLCSLPMPAVQPRRLAEVAWRGGERGRAQAVDRHGAARVACLEAEAMRSVNRALAAVAASRMRRLWRRGQPSPWSLLTVGLEPDLARLVARAALDFFALRYVGLPALADACRSVMRHLFSASLAASPLLRYDVPFALRALDVAPRAGGARSKPAAAASRPSDRNQAHAQLRREALAALREGRHASPSVRDLTALLALREQAALESVAADAGPVLRHGVLMGHSRVEERRVTEGLPWSDPTGDAGDACLTLPEYLACVRRVLRFAGRLPANAAPDSLVLWREADAPDDDDEGEAAGPPRVRVTLTDGARKEGKTRDETESLVRWAGELCSRHLVPLRRKQDRDARFELCSADLGALALAYRAHAFPPPEHAPVLCTPTGLRAFTSRVRRRARVPERAHLLVTDVSPLREWLRDEHPGRSAREVAAEAARRLVAESRLARSAVRAAAEKKKDARRRRPKRPLSDDDDDSSTSSAQPKRSRPDGEASESRRD